MKRVRLVLAVTVAALMSLPVAASASRRNLTLQETAAQADLVFAATVIETAGGVNEAGFPFTDVTLAAEQVVSGAKRIGTDGTITLRFAGGEVDGLKVSVSEVPQLEIGGRYVLLVSPDEGTFSPIVGVNQGVFPIRVEPATGRELVLTPAGQFIERVENGKLVAGSRALLADGGRFVSETVPAAKDTPLLEARSTDEKKVRVIAVKPVPAATATDPASAMTLDGFLESIERLAPNGNAGAR